MERVEIESEESIAIRCPEKAAAKARSPELAQRSIFTSR
jgi:hypothetical protein